MSNYILDFENPLKDIENKIESLKKTSFDTGIDVSDSLKELENKLNGFEKILIKTAPLEYKNFLRFKLILSLHPKN